MIEVCIHVFVYVCMSLYYQFYRIFFLPLFFFFFPIIIHLFSFLLQGILDASRQRHNILWRSKSETNLKSTSAHANRPTQTNHENNNLSLNDNVDSSNNNDNRHKSSEELTAYETTYNALTVRIPSPCNGDEVRRPKSWSPDDHTAGLLFPQDSDQGKLVHRMHREKKISLNLI